MAQLNEAEAARVALEQVWRQLAPVVDEAKQFEKKAQRDPKLVEDPWANALMRFLTVFQSELAAVQTIYEAAESGARLAPDDLRAAREAGEKLAHIVEETRQHVPAPTTATASGV